VLLCTKGLIPQSKERDTINIGSYVINVLKDGRKDIFTNGKIAAFIEER
jgi:hypothetical protein